MNTLHRLKKYLINKGISNKKFEETLGFSNGSFGSQLKNNRTIGVDKLEKILTHYTDLNPVWLLLNKGEMILSSDGDTNFVNEPGVNYSKKQEYSTESLQYQINVINEKLAEFDKLKQTLGSLITAEVQHQMHTSKKNVIEQQKKGVE